VAAAHETAEVSHDFAPLCRTATLPAGRVSVVELPAVDPWGILVVEPDNGHERAVWQPGIWCDEGSRCDEKLVVRLDCATRGGDIRYTLDGSQPTESSALYRQPLRLGASVELKARTFGPGGANGPVASARFHRNEARPRSAPDAPALRDSLRLWLKAETLAATLQDGDQVKKWPAVVGPGAALPAAKLLSGATADAPTFGKAILNRRPAVHFDGVDDQMVIPQFANGFLAGKPLTVVLVTQSADNSFGVCGNATNGSGGVPRLYMTRAAFNYDKHGESVPVNAPLDLPAITVYRHDGRKTASARCNGRPTGNRDDLPVVKAFGGGNLAFPLWVATSHSGELAEIVAYDRALADSDIEALEEDLAQRYGIAILPRWR
jgi:hypothetical protein